MLAFTALRESPKQLTCLRCLQQHGTDAHVVHDQNISDLEVNQEPKAIKVT